jgi:ABC-2 type transport system permease protein
MPESVATASRISLPAPRPRPSLTTILGNETFKGLLVLWANRGTLVPKLAVLVIFYLFIQFFIGSGRLVQALFAPSLIGFASYALAYIVSLKMVAGTLEEMNAGTLEQIHLSPLPSWALSLGRLAAAATEAVGLTALVSTGLILVLGIRFDFRLDALLPIVLTILDVAGFGLLLGGLAIRVTSIGAVLHVMQGIVLFLNGAFVPVSLFPAWLQVVARLLPTTLGVEVTQKILLRGDSLATVWADGSLVWLLAHTALMVIVGAVAYQLSIRRALREGRLGPR